MKDNFIENIDKKFDNNDQKINCICTLLGCSANLVEFVQKTHGIKNLDIKMKYIIALVASNVISLTQDGKPVQKDMASQTKEYFMGEQTQERIYRTMKNVIVDLYNSVKDEEL